MDVAAFGRAMTHTRIVLHCHPTFPNEMHERVGTAMVSGCVVVSDTAPALTAGFTAGSDWLRP